MLRGAVAPTSCFDASTAQLQKGAAGAGKLDPMSRLGVQELSYAMADVNRLNFCHMVERTDC